MEGVTGGTAGNNNHVRLEKEERESLVACATEILKEENDVEILKSIVGLLRDLKTNAEVRKSFRENGWGFISKGQNRDLKLQQNSNSSSMKMKQEQPKPKPNGKGRLDYETHPMENDLIRKKIFDYCSVSDLKSCRLVSKAWRDLCLTSWRQKAVLRVADLFGESYTDVVEFSRNASELVQIPFQRYNLDCADWCLGDSHQVLLDFFSPAMQYVKIYCVDLDTIALLLTKLPELREATLIFPLESLSKQYNKSRENSPFLDSQPTTSKLSKLELQIVHPRHHRHSDVEFSIRPTLFYSFPWNNFFRSTPALKSLQIGYGQTIDNGVINVLYNVMQSLYEVRNEGNFSTLNLEELNIIDPEHPFPVYPWVAARSIAESHFPLKELHIDLGTMNFDLSEISRLLEAHAETLQFLKCNIGPITDATTLEEYEEEGRITEYVELPLTPDLPAKVKLPNLKELGIGSGCIWAFHLLRSWDVPNLDHFWIQTELTLSDPKSEGGQQFDMKRTVPRSQVFSDAAYLPSLSLQSLGVLATGKAYFLCDDYAITGYRSGNDGRREPNITDLKNLREFVLETWNGSDEVFPRPRKAWITDSSAIYGFLQLPKLQFLQVDSICEFSPGVMTALEDHISELIINEPQIFHDFDEDSYSSEENEENEQLQEEVGSEDE